MIEAIGRIGKSSIQFSRSLAETVDLSCQIVNTFFHRRTYNSATLSVLINQIYFTAVEILPLFITVSIVLGSLIMGLVLQTLKTMGLTQYLGNILIGFAVNELSPFVTVLLIALRSGSAINTEIAVMKVNKELDTLRAFRIDPVNYLFFPRIVNGMVSLVLLTGLFSIVLVISGGLFSRIIFGMGLNIYTDLLVRSIHLYDVVILLIKCATYGFFITLIPIISGMRATYQLTTIPVAVLHGMIRVFLAIIFIEVLTLIARSVA
jgi:phospholipid/cholesterol/gamma-HCH transport system permease protein